MTTRTTRSQPPPGYDPSQFPPFAVTVDIVILTVRQGQLCVLLIRRGGHPFLGRWAELAAEHRVTIWNSVPAQMQMLSDYLAGVPEEARPDLRLALLSGDWIPVTLPDAIRALQPQLKVVSLGGATEASIWAASNR